MESGTTHPNTASDCNTSGVPLLGANTHLRCSFDIANIHRLITPTNSANLSSTLSSNFPEYDQVVVIGNTPYYGGLKGEIATITNHASAGEIAAHELGHSFADLADEYYAGDQYFREHPNMTQQPDPNLVKWKNWIGTNGIGVYQYCCGGWSPWWYKPHNNCKMEFLGPEYCSVCKEAIIEAIHGFVKPVVSYTPAPGTTIESTTGKFLDFRFTKLIKPIPNTLKVQWKLDGTVISENSESVRLDQNIMAPGTHTLTATVTDTTALLRVDSHSARHNDKVTWSFRSAPLPVTLIDFKVGVYEDKVVRLQWKTVMEMDFDHFELERSASPKDGFSSLATIKGKNNRGSDYSFEDRTADAGVIWYYRLKMIDNDESFAYSRIVDAVIEADGSLSIYPNPANKELNIEAAYAMAKVELTNLTGIKVLTESADGKKRKKIKLPALPKGTYLLRITGNNKIYETRKLIIE